MKEDVVIIIPAYNPGTTLKRIIEDLRKEKFKNIIVVNDGSTTMDIFTDLPKEILIITHFSNKGKGEALKTGFKYVTENYKNILGVITMDADGQHTIDDINKVYKKFKKQNNALILGSRSFNKKCTPLKNRWGNCIISNKIKKKTGIKINDTQTGLRAIPKDELSSIYKIEGSRYEYETSMLLYFIKKKRKIIEEQISTIYINKNKQSSFKTLSDSKKILKIVGNFNSVK